jgi:NTE family protein
MAMMGGLVGRKRKPPKPDEVRRGGLLDPTGIERIVREAIPFDRIRENLRSGTLSALSVSTTDVASGRTVIFVERKDGGLPRWSRDPTIEVRATEITPEHALASAAVPFFFPAVRIGEDFHCDGGLRQNVPLSPARRLGAEGLIVVNPRYVDIPAAPAPVGDKLALERETNYPGPLFLLGKALNALLLDRIDNDIARLRRINDILDAGERHYGPTFVDEINRELSGPAKISQIHPLRVVHVRAGADIGRMAGEYVRSRDFAARAPGITGRLLRRIGEWEGEGEADLLSYLLFDGEFASRLIDLGRADAARHHAALCALFEERIR